MEKNKFKSLLEEVRFNNFINNLVKMNEENIIEVVFRLDEETKIRVIDILEARLPKPKAKAVVDAIQNSPDARTQGAVNDLKKQNNMAEPAADLSLNDPNSLRAQFARGPATDAGVAKADAAYKATSQKIGARRAKDLKADSLRAKYAQGPVKDPTDAGRISPDLAAELKAKASAGANKYAPGEGLGDIRARAVDDANAKIKQADDAFNATSQGIRARRAAEASAGANKYAPGEGLGNIKAKADTDLRTSARTDAEAKAKRSVALTDMQKKVAGGLAGAVALGTTAALLSKSSNDKGAQANNPYPSRERSFADKTKDVEKEFFVPKPGTTKYNIRMGSKGEDVKRLQQAIGVKADGIMGKNTADALANFQKQHGLKVDRIGGDQTFGKIKQIEALKNLRDADPKGAQSFAQSQIDNPAKRIGAGSIQTQSLLGGKRIFPDSKKLNMGFEHTSPLIEAFKKLHSSNIPNLFEAAKKAKKDWDGDGEVESGTDEWKGSRDKAIKKAMRNEESEGKKDAEKNPMSHEKDAGTLKKPLRQLTPDEMPVSKVEKTGKQSSTAYKIEEEIEISEARESFTKGTRKIKTYSHGDYHAEVRHNPDWQEYQVHFYKNGKHMGEGPVSYHGEDKEDAHDSAKAGLEFLNKRNTMSESVSFSEAELAHIASILEGNPIAPVPDDYSGAAGGVSVRDLSDETVAEGIRGMRRKDSKFKDSPKRYSNEYPKGYREPGTKSKAEARDEMEKAVASYRARGGKIKKK
jgi:peptidoglycan hydrolase-like protein with peptidoglycan-binding domain